MIDFIRSLLESALKTNPYLEKCVITGCLRISKESIFTGLNNLKYGYRNPTGFRQWVVHKRVHEEITYGDIHESEENLWNFLFFTGYLKKVGESIVYSLTARVETADLILSCKRQIFEKAA